MNFNRTPPPVASGSSPSPYPGHALRHSHAFDMAAPTSRTSSASSSSSSEMHPRDLVTSVALDSQWLVLGLANSQVSVYSTRTGQLVRSFVGHKAGVWAVALISRGGRSWSGAASEEERDSRSLGASTHAYVGKRSDPCHASEGWGQRNALVVSAGSDQTVAVWDVFTGICNHIMRGHAGTVRCVRTLHNRPIAVSGSRDATLRVWDLNKGRLIRVLKGHSEGVTCMEVCGNRVVSGSYDSTCRIWNVDSGDCGFILTGHQGRIYSVAFDGAIVVSGSHDATARIWDSRTGQCLQSLSTSPAAVMAVTISPSSSLLACASTDGTVVVYSLATFAIVQALAPHQSPITALQFETSTSDQSLLLTAGNDGWVRRINLDKGQYLRDLCERAECIWKLLTKDDICAVVCQRNGVTVVEIWSTNDSAGDD